MRAEVVAESQASKAHFAALHLQKAEIEAEVQEPLTWYNPPDKQMCRIHLRRSVDIGDRASWPEYHEWLRQKLELLHHAFPAGQAPERRSRSGGLGRSPSDRMTCLRLV